MNLLSSLARARYDETELSMPGGLPHPNPELERGYRRGFNAGVREATRIVRLHLYPATAPDYVSAHEIGEQP